MRRDTKHGDDEQVLVVGSDPAAAVLARNLSERVLFQGPDERITRRVANEVRDSEVIGDVGQITPRDGITTAVVATPDDSTNLLVAQRLRLETDVDLVVRLNDPSRRRAFADLGMEVVCASTEVGEALVEQYARQVHSTE